MTLLNELLFREIDLPDLIPDVIPKEREPSDPMEEPDVEFEEDNVKKKDLTIITDSKNWLKWYNG